MKNFRDWTTAFILAAAPIAVYAQEGEEEAAVETPGFMDIVLTFDNPINLLIWLLIFLCSAAVLAFIVDGILQTQRSKILPDELINGVRGALDEGDLDSAIHTCETNPSQLSNILMAGFTNITEGYDIVQDSVKAATELESEKILQRISYLNLCGQIAPMLGLLGTVTGMVSAFAGMASNSGDKDTKLAMAISGALWTTVCGLLIAVPALLAFTIFKNIAVQRLLESEATVLDLIKTLRNAEVEDEEYEEYEE
ncbi:MAG: MotA/TolQ/ExbB proton channel family protein [Lentisphaeria bacterium]|nr:MotA/TolQ/ExbB proton channel family protein [Lentisphaeria bacterium]